MILVDSNIPMYLVGSPHPHKSDAQRLLLATCHSSLLLQLAEEDRWRNMETLAEPRDVVPVQSTLAGKNQ